MKANHWFLTNPLRLCAVKIFEKSNHEVFQRDLKKEPSHQRLGNPKNADGGKILPRVVPLAKTNTDCNPYLSFTN
jgi:hypothetical protein